MVELRIATRNAEALQDVDVGRLRTALAQQLSAAGFVVRNSNAPTIATLTISTVRPITYDGFYTAATELTLGGLVRAGSRTRATQPLADERSGRASDAGAAARCMPAWTSGPAVDSRVTARRFIAVRVEQLALEQVRALVTQHRGAR
jgi:hypothetical protein